MTSIKRFFRDHEWSWLALGLVLYLLPDNSAGHLVGIFFMFGGAIKLISD